MTHLAGSRPTIGFVSDACDALAETTIGLDKTESVQAGSRLRGSPKLPGWVVWAYCRIR